MDCCNCDYESSCWPVLKFLHNVGIRPCQQGRYKRGGRQADITEFPKVPA